ncbi:hypothetical protein DPEC_G00195420 [Dallia pectoralis]|uniref:Uncharacterized protein n=1 Tax=Dallia pectoralis TaxID=75939 RepID=A0ACC2G731_DALPE|nr:hypothetical protein DPEC_G00195420 [Dallia pectoralis]
MALCKRGAQCCVTTIMRCCYPFKDVSAVSTYSQMLAYSRISVLSSRHYSSSQGKLGVFQRANDRCMNILQQRFPQLYILYTTFVKGFRLMVHDVKETKRIRMKMLTESVPLRELPYHEMKTIILFRKDMIKTIPLIIISIPPFAIFLVFALMCLFPRQLLIRHLWTPQQQQDFQRLYHEQRCQHRDDILKGVAWSIPHVKVWTLRSHLLTLINKMQSGTHPSVTDLHAVRDVFSGIPLGLSDMDWGHMRLMSSHLLLNPWLPGFFLRRRLRAKALDMLYLDQALDTLGQDRLTDTEIREACYLRGLDPSSLTTSQCQEWLQQWLQLSTQLTESETSLLLHNMVLLTVNYPRPRG